MAEIANVIEITNCVKKTNSKVQRTKTDRCKPRGNSKAAGKRLVENGLHALAAKLSSKLFLDGSAPSAKDNELFGILEQRVHAVAQDQHAGVGVGGPQMCWEVLLQVDVHAPNAHVLAAS